MWTISELKTQGKAAVKANYWKCVLAAFLLMLLVGGTSAAAGANRNSAQTEALQQQLNAMPQDQRIAVALAILGGVAVILVISLLLRIFLFNPLKVGCLAFFLENTAEPPAELGAIGRGFRNYGHTFATLFLADLFLVLWSMLLIIPGIIKAYSYRMVPYILAENPDLSATETITLSREMMNGHKWNAFLLDLSFIGWFLLGALTLGLVNLFWTNPYKESTDAALYLAIR